VRKVLGVNGLGVALWQKKESHASQSERQGKHAGCRMTNDRKHRKACPGGDSWQSREESRGEPLFDGRSLPAMGKQLGTCTHGLDGVKGGDTHGRNRGAKSGESLSGSAPVADKGRYKPRGESRPNARQEVGDGHSSADGGDSTTPPEQRAISLDVPPNTGGDGVNARKATSTSKKRSQVLWDGLYESAKKQPERKYGNLYDKLWRPDILHEAWRRVRANKGAPGVDGESVAWIKSYGVDLYLAELAAELRAEDFRPGLVKRVFIPKGDGRLRPLGIPTVTDRVVQMAVKLVVEPLFEADFLPCSYGFRPKTSSHHALRVIDDHLRRGYRWVVDVDLKSYLDTVSYCVPSHGRLSKRVGCGSSTLMRRPLRLPRRTWTAESSPRFTRCKTVCRKTPSIRVASSMGTYPGGSCSWKRWRSRSSTRMRQGEPGVSCSPTMKPSEIQR